MIPPRLPGLFIAGTDTDSGKTFLATTIVRHLAAQGFRPGVYKPAASGGDADALALWNAAGRPLTSTQVCPQSFRAPLAPHHAALAEGREIDEELLVAGIEPWLRASDVVIVEGAGGLFSPLSTRLLNADLALRLALRAVLVDRGTLGCVGRILATCTAARARGIGIAAVVVSQAAADDGRPGHDPTSPRRIAEDGAREARIRLADIPVVLLPHGGAETVPPVGWMALARGH